jgi:hypothetical protein
VSFYTNFFEQTVPTLVTNFSVKLVDPLILDVSVQDDLGTRHFTGTNINVEAVNSAAVTLSSKYPSGTIFYTTNGTPPSALSQRYYTPIYVSGGTDVRAIAYSSDFSESQERDIHIQVVPAVSLQFFSNLGAGDPYISAESLARPGTVARFGAIAVPSNSVVRLQATNLPAGAEFLGWLGYTNSTNSEIDLLVTRSGEILENLRSTNNVVPIEASAHGTVVLGEKVRSFQTSGSVSMDDFQQLTSIPDAGYFFAGYKNWVQDRFLSWQRFRVFCWQSYIVVYILLP